MSIRRRAMSAGLGLCTAVLLVACSGTEDTTACVGLVRSLTEGSQKIAAAVEDPATAGAELRAFADDLRSEAEGTSEAVTSAANDLATLYDDMADDLETSGVPDMSQLTAGVLRLEDACG